MISQKQDCKIYLGGIIRMDDLRVFMSIIKTNILTGAPKFLSRAVWVIFLLMIMQPVIRFIESLLDKIFSRSKVDPLLRTFVLSLVKTVVYIIFFFLIVGGIGIKATSLVALLGTAGVAVGLALQGSLSNIAGGVLILFFKPFSKGDYITTSLGSGVVHSIYILYTVLLTIDNKRITIPNGQIANTSITNLSKEKERRVDLVISASYDNDVKKVKEVLTRIADENDKILHDKGYTIRLSAHSSSSLDYNFRVWVRAEDYWEVYYSLMETVVVEFKKENLEIPYQKIDIYQK